MYFRPATTNDKGEDTDPNLRVLEFKKSNYSHISESILLRWKNGVFVKEPSTGSVEKMACDRRVDDVFMKLLERFTRDGRNVGDKKGTSYAPVKFVDEPEAKAAKCGKEALAAAMRRLFAAGKIRMLEEGPPSHRRARMVVVEAGNEPSTNADVGGNLVEQP